MVGKGGRVRKKRGMWVEFQKANKETKQVKRQTIRSEKSHEETGKKIRVLHKNTYLILPNNIPHDGCSSTAKTRSAMTPSRQGGLEYENAVLSRRKKFFLPCSSVVHQFLLKQSKIVYKNGKYDAVHLWAMTAAECWVCLWEVTKIWDDQRGIIRRKRKEKKFKFAYNKSFMFMTWRRSTLIWVMR